MSRDPKAPWLVQRARLRPAEDRRGRGSAGLDGAFDWECMGASEFEAGALSRALADLRRQTLTGPTKIVLGTREGKATDSVWFVGAAEHFDVARAFFLDQMTVGRMPLKVNADIRQSLRPPCFSSWVPCVAWWCIDPGAGWALLATEEAAAWWVAAVSRAPVKL